MAGLDELEMTRDRDHGGAESVRIRELLQRLEDSAKTMQAEIQVG